MSFERPNASTEISLYIIVQQIITKLLCYILSSLYNRRKNNDEICFYHLDIVAVECRNSICPFVDDEWWCWFCCCCCCWSRWCMFVASILILSWSWYDRTSLRISVGGEWWWWWREVMGGLIECRWMSSSYLKCGDVTG